MGGTTDSGMLVAVTMLSVRVLQFQISRCPSVGCARHKIVLTSFVLITDSRVDGCPRPWTTLHTAMDNVAHGHVQRTTPVQRTDFALAESSKRGIGTGNRPEGALVLHAHSYLGGRAQSQAMDKKGRMRSNVTHVSHFYPFYNARMRCLACPAKPSETR